MSAHAQRRSQSQEKTQSNADAGHLLPAASALADAATEWWCGADEEQAFGEGSFLCAAAAQGGRIGAPPPDLPEDGSGEHGVEGKIPEDYASWVMWQGVAAGAGRIGYDVAADHMQHFLGNSGATKEVDVGRMISEVAWLEDKLEEMKGKVHDEALAVLEGADLSQYGAWAAAPVGCGTTFTKGGEPNWFFAVGAFNLRGTADVSWVPLPGDCGVLSYEMDVELIDRYNWDQGKSVEIAGLTVPDETLGRLHRAGLAKEFDLTGQTELWWESMVTEAEIHDTAVHRAASPLAVVDEEGA